MYLNFKSLMPTHWGEVYIFRFLCDCVLVEFPFWEMVIPTFLVMGLKLPESNGSELPGSKASKKETGPPSIIFQVLS